MNEHLEKMSIWTAVRRRIARWLLPLQLFWAALLVDLEAIRGAPAVAALLAVCAALMLMEQGSDLAVTAGSDTCKASWMVLATAFYGFQCWFWTRFILEQQRRRSPEAFTGRSRAPKLIGWLREWTPRLLGGAPFFIAWIATARAKVDLVALPYIFFGLGLGLAAVFVLWARRRVAAYFRLFNRGLFNRLCRWGTFVLGLGSLAVLCVWPVGPAQFLGAISVVFLGLAFITAGLAYMLHASRATRLPVLTLLVLLALAFSVFNDNHAIGRRTLQRMTDADRAMPLPPARPVPVGAADLPDPRTGKDTIAMRLDAWCKAQGPQACQPGGPETPIVFVAAEGGASRAGYWAADVLGKLQFETKDQGKPFSDRVFAISSVSGGSVGVMAYVSTLADKPGLSGAPFADGVAHVAGIDYLSPAVGGMLFPDLAQRFLPVAAPFLPDRAETLETGFESGWRQHCRPPNDNDLDHGTCSDDNLWTRPFLSLWRPPAGSAAPSWLPIVMINGARQEDGRRIITASVAVTPEDFPNAIDFHALTRRDVRISTAILNGARFPLVSPGGTLIRPDGTRAGHVLDGGYFDGGGVATMADVAAATLRIANAKTIRLKPVFIELNNDTDSDDTAADLIRAGARDCKAPPGTTPPGCEPGALFKSPTHDFAADLLGPLDGLAASRGSHGTAAAMSLAQTVLDHGGQVARDARAAPGAPAPTTGSGEWGVSPTYRLVHLCKPSSGQVPMDWALSKSAMQHADEALGILTAPGSGRPLIAPDLKMKSTCLAESKLRDILADVGLKAPGGQTRPAPGRMKGAHLWLWLAATGLAAVAGALIIAWADRKLHRLKLPTTVSLQRRRTAQAFGRAVARWRAASDAAPRVFSYVWTALGFDLLLIAGYAGSAVILALLLILNQPLDGHGGPVHAYLTPVFQSGAALVLLAAIADLAEDGLEAWMIVKGARDGLARAAHAATQAKWLLLAVGALVMAVGAVLGCERGG